MRTLVWFRGKDLRVADHGPLNDAVEKGEVVPLFVLDPYFFDPKRAKAIPHRMQFLTDSLLELEQRIAKLGSRLILVTGKSVEVVPRLAREWKVDRVVAQRWVEPFARLRDTRVKEALQVPFELFEGETLHPPGTLRTGSGGSYSVYTPFSKAFARESHLGEPLPAPKRLPALPKDIKTKSAAIPELPFARSPQVQRGGEEAAHERLEDFIEGPADRYPVLRNDLGAALTSRLSADLKFGTLSPRTVWSRCREKLEPKAWASYSNELVWRDFTHSTLWDRPELFERPFRPAWEGFPWTKSSDGFDAWAKGLTGYPVVDASARQLLGEGFVHNRARMISGSFLTKHLLVDYHRGEQHYLKWLTDGDWAQNNMGWQWSAGCGCDAQPYFRIFNPVAQGERFDTKGDYVRRWVPELAKLPTKFLHAPWLAPPEVLKEAGVTLGKTYPRPIVDHAMARARFLDLAQMHLRR